MKQHPNNPYRRSAITTPLMELLRATSEEQKQALAERAGTTVNYLYSIAGCHRERIAVSLAVGIEDASRELHAETLGATPIVTVRELATMCHIAQFPHDI